MQQAEILNYKFLNVEPNLDGTDPLERIEREISDLIEDLKLKREEYLRLMKGKSALLRPEDLDAIEDIYPFLKRKHWIEITDTRINFRISKMPMQITQGGDRLLYRSFPLYSYNVRLPISDGPMTIENTTTLDNRCPYFEAVESTFGHPHSDSRNKTFSNFCAGNNPFKDMYYNHRIKTPKDICEFIIQMISWLQNINATDLFGGASPYLLMETKHDFPGYEELMSEMMKNGNPNISIFKTVNEVFARHDTTPLSRELFNLKLFVSMFYLTNKVGQCLHNKGLHRFLESHIINLVKWDIASVYGPSPLFMLKSVEQDKVIEQFRTLNWLTNDKRFLEVIEDVQ